MVCVFIVLCCILGKKEVKRKKGCVFIRKIKYFILFLLIGMCYMIIFIKKGNWEINFLFENIVILNKIEI